ncbi:mitochondrial arginine transporter BAC2-like [Prosopis cineraria]|uniref:mitochondrial arginine transporter BAC2-like n=1 Tax=Prosopis cineraria TaxID=364024 RepID=UPI0024102B38|nr:mitochondrial arginine transporter BAC2-like [Prosopis cineraria]
MLWGEFVGSSWSREFVAGGVGGMAGVISGYPLDTLRIHQQNSNMPTSVFSLIKDVVSNEGLASLYRGMAAPLAAITFQNAMIFQTYAVLSRAFDSSVSENSPPSYRSVALAGLITGALQSTIVSPVELVKIRLQLQRKGQLKESCEGPLSATRKIWKREGLRGIFRGFSITILRDAPSHGVYFWTYEYMREQLHPGCRKTSQESLSTMLIAGGLAGVVSWIGSYPLDVIKTRLQAQTQSSLKYTGILDCVGQSVREEGHNVLWRGIGTTVGRAFIVNGAVFAAYEIAIRSLSNSGSSSTKNLGDPSFSRNSRQ